MDLPSRSSQLGAPTPSPDVDTVICAGWHRPVSDLYFALKGRGVPVERVGDAIASRTMMEAVHEGERAARRIGVSSPKQPVHFPVERAGVGFAPSCNGDDLSGFDFGIDVCGRAAAPPSAHHG